MGGLTVAAEEESGRNGARLRRLATALTAIAVAEAIAVMVLSAVGDPAFRIGLDLVTIGFLASIVLFPVVGALIIQRRPSTRVAWLMVAIGLGLGTGLVVFGWGAIAMNPGRWLPGALEAVVVSQLFFLPTLASGAALLLLLFPTDRLPGPRWRAVAVLSVAGSLVYEVGTVFRTGPLDREAFPGVQNPLAAPAALSEVVDGLTTAGNAMVTAGILLAAASLVVRYRRAGPVEAAQIRWIALVAGFAAVAFAIAGLQIGPESDFAFGIGLILLACMPIAIGIAITRYRLYEIDRLINRALLYGSLTAILAGVFTAAVGLGQRMFVGLTGQSSDAAIVLTTLVVATLYAPLRKRLEAIVDADDRPVATAGQWPVPPVVRLPIPGVKGLAAVLVGPRLDGRPHDPRSIAQLQEVAALVATAVRLHAKPEG